MKLNITEKHYLMKIIMDEQTSLTDVLLYGDGGKVMSDEFTQEIYEQYQMEC